MIDDQYQEIVANLLMLENKLRELGGCSDGNCCIVRPQGMHTNGGCKCVNEARWDQMQRIKIERVVRSYQMHVEAIRKAMDISRTVDLRKPVHNHELHAESITISPKANKP